MHGADVNGRAKTRDLHRATETFQFQTIDACWPGMHSKTPGEELVRLHTIFNAKVKSPIDREQVPGLQGDRSRPNGEAFPGVSTVREFALHLGLRRFHLKIGRLDGPRI